ncbi:hypothetical protein RRG08_024518 [Elysia crispata]|uniref:Fanconi anemia group A protein n=1 Tax=Elysia crispata TaxID=231223 RepID=A0AAE0Y941_9GAST|nr:hypothetical protein RRG08_024518 [Elysia crispata]
MLSEEDRVGLIDAANQIIDSTLDSKALFNEACSLSKKLRVANQNIDEQSIATETNGSQVIEKFLRATCPSCIALDGKEVNLLLKTPNLVRQILEISQENSSCQESLLSDSLRERLEVCMKMVKFSLETSCLNQEMFISMLRKHALQLEVIWNLHKAAAVDLGSFLTSKLNGEEAYQIQLSKALVDLCMGPLDTQQLRQKILSDIILYLLNQTFSDKKTSTGQLERQVLNAVLQDVLELQIPIGEEESVALPSNFLATTTIADAKVVHKYAIHSLSLILSHGANNSVEDCMKSETDWMSYQTSGCLQSMIKEFFLALNYSEVSGVLKRALEHQSVNSRHIYAYLSCLYTCFAEASTSLKDYLLTLISSAFDKSSCVDLYVPFFLARLSTAIGSHCFPSYSDWFQTTFCNPSSLMMSRASYNLLIKFLTSLVPWESPERLKAYIFHKPNLPVKCKNQYQDFVDLAKTQLMDLGVPLNEKVTCMYGNNSDGSNNSNEEDQMNKARAVDSTEQDVQKAVAAFAESRKIPAVLMQASIFQKPYFMGKFLPALMKPRVLPDHPDERMLLIAELNKSGKIQTSAYDQYLQACEREKQALLEGVFDVDDDEEMEELTLPVMQQLQIRLDKFTHEVLTGSYLAQSGCLSTVIEKVSAIVAESSLSSPNQESKISNRSIVINLCDLHSLQTDSMSKISKLIVDQLSGMVVQWREQSRKEHQSGVLPANLATHVVQLIQALLQQFPALRTHLYSTVFAVLNQKEEEGVGKSIHGLPIMCLCVAVLPYNITITKENGKICEVKSFIKALLVCLDIANASEDILRFCVDYVQMACDWLTFLEQQLAQQDVVELGSTCVSEEDLLPPALVKNINFACWRRGLIDSDGSNSLLLKPNVLIGPASTLYGIERWQQLHKKHHLLLVDWMETEWSVNSLVDYLSSTERFSYLLKTSSVFLHHTHDQLSFCKTVILTLARLCGCQSGSSCDSRGKGIKSADFLQLLRKLLVNICPLEGKQSSWLLEILQCADDVNQIIKYALELPAHLLFCNSLQEDFERRNVVSALEIIGYFSGSSQNKGAYLSLEATIYIFQGMESLFTANRSIPASALDPVGMHPLIFLSFLVHKSVLVKLTALEVYNTVSSTWQDRVKATEEWLLSWTESNLSSSLNQKIYLSSVEDWQKAAALFSMILLKKFSFDLSKLKLQENVQFYLLKMMAANLTLRGALEEIETLPDHSLSNFFIEILCHSPAVLRLLLSSESKLQNQLGIQTDSELSYLHDYIILRLAKNIPPDVIMQTQVHNVIARVVSAYWRIQTHAQDGETYTLDSVQLPVDLSRWIKSLVDLASPAHLSSIPDFSCSLRHSDLLLFKYIQEMRRQRK